MCGIIGIIGKAPVAPLLIDALKRLEYRGYDSAGVATLVNGHIDRRRAQGKIANLQARLVEEPLSGTIGIGHTRWATHGKPSERNAHPIATDRVAVVHNGIIENFQELKDELTAEGRTFESDTDTEVVAQLLTSHLERQLLPEQAMAKVMECLRGAFALVVLFSGRHDILLAARRGSSLAVGHGAGEMYVGTDALALAPFTNRVTYLEDNDWVVLTENGCSITNNGTRVDRPIKQSAFTGAMTGKGDFPHFMLKEMHEQPLVIGETLGYYLDANRRVSLPKLPIEWSAVSRITMTACGTALYACLMAKYWFEKLARLPVDVEVASEMSGRKPPLDPKGLCITVSQSGETADTRAAVTYAKSVGQRVLSVVNVPESALARMADVALPTFAGPEIAVASTKAFATQLTVLLCAAIDAGRARGTLTREEEQLLTTALVELPSRMGEILGLESQFKELGATAFMRNAVSALFIGRGYQSVVALEGALKLKELSYIHAEGFAGGEMKHGSIALLAPELPVFVLAPPGEEFEQMVSSFEQVRARDGQIILLSDEAGTLRLGGGAHGPWNIALPGTHPDVAPILYCAAVQLIAYHTAVVRGCDVDQPRHLAKSVTVA